MKGVRFALGVSLFVVLLVSASLAQTGDNSLTYVSAQGADSHACSVTAPCKTFAGALAKTAPGGEVVVLSSSGAYGPFNISHAVTIEAPSGVYAGITQVSNSTDGIFVSAGTGDIVTLKGLTVIGPAATPTGGVGINFSSGAALHIEGCEVREFSTNIVVSNAVSQLFIKDTVVKDGYNGILLVQSGTAGTMYASMDHITANNNVNGIALEGTMAGAVIEGAIRDSTLSGNGTGVSVEAFSGGTALLDVESCLIANGGEGISTVVTESGTAGMSISNCLISHNSGNGFLIQGNSFFQGGGSSFIVSRGNNTFTGNGPNVGILGAQPAQ
ncbi:MAG TPA: hypothetical protein VI756_26835 [Blastocatellia bacterium]